MSENTSPPEPTIGEELAAAKDHCVEVIEYLKTGQSRQSRGMDIEPYNHFTRLAPARNALAEIGRHMNQLCASHRLPADGMSFLPLLIDTCTSDRFRFHGFGDFLAIAINLETWLVAKLANVDNPPKSTAALSEDTENAEPIAPPPESPEKPTEPRNSAAKKSKGMSKEDADVRARALVDQDPEKFAHMSERKQAKLIGCSWDTWRKTGLYNSAEYQKAKKAIAAEREKSAKDRGPRNVCSFTQKMEKVAFAEETEAAKQDLLKRLTKEQQSEMRADPSPLEDDPPDLPPKKVKMYKRV